MVSGKKVALWGCLGCGGFVFLVFVVPGIFIAYRGIQFGKEIGQAYREVAVGYTAIDQEYPFVRPEDGIMNEERLKTFLQIRGDIAEYAHEQIQKLEETGEEIGRQFESPGIISKIRGVTTIKDIIGLGAGLAANIGNEHVRLLGGDDMSTKEYEWLTFIYLGTLAKAKDNDADVLAGHWTRYLDAFESARKKTRDVKIDLGRTSIRGGDMNRDELLKALDRAVFSPMNAEIVTRTIDQLLPDDGVGTLDFIALHLDRIIKHLQEETWDGDLDLDGIIEESQREPGNDDSSTDSP